MLRPLARLAPSFAFSMLLLLLVASVGCSKSYIPNTDVEDTSDNRKVVLFCEQYRHAVEEKNVGQILRMVSPTYFEDGGNTTGDDDMDFEGLKKFLTTEFMNATGIRYEIRYRRVTFTETNHVYVDYTYAAAFRIPGVKGEEWKHKVSDNRLDLEREGDSFKITAGM
jgi:hypothetical protein